METIDPRGTFNRLNHAGFNEPFQAGTFLLTDLDQLYGDPMVMNLPHLREADIDARVFTLQPEAHLHEVPGSQQIGRSHLSVGIGEIHDAPIGFKMPVDADQHAVDGQIGDRPAGLMFF